MEEYYKNLIYYLPDIIYQIDARGKLVYINDSVKKLGYDPEELIGSDFSVIVAEKDRRSTNLLNFIADNGSGGRVEGPGKYINERRTGNRITKNLSIELLPRDRIPSPGEEICGEVFATGLYENAPDGSRRHSGTIGILRFSDVDRKSRMNLVRLEHHYRVLLENSFEIIAILAHDGTILYISNSVERNIGFKSIDLIGENIESLVVEEDRRVVENIFRKLIAIGDAGKKTEFRLKEISGNWKYYETMVTSIINRDRNLTMCYVFHMNDITKRKTIETAGLKREQMYKLLLRTSPDAIFLIDEQCDIIMANDQAVALTRCPREELIASRFFDIIKREKEEGPENLLEQIKETGILRDVPLTISVSGNAPLPVEASFSIIKDSEKPIGYLSIIKDVTSRKRVEEEREKLKKELLKILFKRLSKREVELLHHISRGFAWPEQKREIGKAMNVQPSTLDQFVYRIKKKMELTDLLQIARIASIHFGWPPAPPAQ